MILVKSISNQLKISWSQWQKPDNCNFVTERREEGKRSMNTEKQMKRMGVGEGGKTITITVHCKCKGEMEEITSLLTSAHTAPFHSIEQR